MVEVDQRIIKTGIICLTIIYLAILFTKGGNPIIENIIIGVIALSIGVVIPAPKIDNKRGVLIW